MPVIMHDPGLDRPRALLLTSYFGSDIHTYHPIYQLCLTQILFKAICCHEIISLIFPTSVVSFYTPLNGISTVFTGYFFLTHSSTSCMNCVIRRFSSFAPSLSASLIPSASAQLPGAYLFNDLGGKRSQINQVIAGNTLQIHLSMVK